MANCCDMKEGDLYHCDTCGLELKVKKACACNSGSKDACSVPLMCCGKEMTKKSIYFWPNQSDAPENVFQTMFLTYTFGVHRMSAGVMKMPSKTCRKIL